MNKQTNDVTLEYNIPIPDNFRGGKAQEIAKSMTPGASCLVPTMNKAISLRRALKGFGHGAVIRMEKDKKSGKLLGFRVWRSS